MSIRFERTNSRSRNGHTPQTANSADAGDRAVDRRRRYESSSDVSPVESLLTLTDDQWRHADERCRPPPPHWRRTTVDRSHVTREHRASVDWGQLAVGVVQPADNSIIIIIIIISIITVSVINLLGLSLSLCVCVWLIDVDGFQWTLWGGPRLKTERTGSDLAVLGLQGTCASVARVWRYKNLIIMRPSSLGGAAYCVALCLSVCLSVRPSRYRCHR